MALRQGLKKGLGSLGAVPVVIAIVVVVNLLALAFFFRIDLTSSRMYSLSAASKRKQDPVYQKAVSAKEALGKGR